MKRLLIFIIALIAIINVIISSKSTDAFWHGVSGGCSVPGTVADLSVGSVAGTTVTTTFSTPSGTPTSYSWSNDGTTWNTFTPNSITGLTVRTAYSAFRIRASNACGNGVGSNQVSFTTICTTDGNDGYAGAPVATIQYPSLLAGYVKTPASCVAGADYAVGIPTAQSLTDWQSIGSSIPGFTCVSGTGVCTATCSSGDLTITGYDFSLHGGAYINVTTNNCNVTVNSSKFGNTPTSTPYTIHVQTTNSNLTVNQSYFTGGNNTYGAFIGYQATGTVTLTYNYFTTGTQHVIEQVTGTMTTVYKYNLIENMGVGSGAHNNWLQWNAVGSNVTTSTTIYNTGYQTTIASNPACQGEGFQFYANSSGTLGTTTLSNNVMIAKTESNPSCSGNPNGTMSYIVHGGTVGSGTNTNNYFDISGALGAYYPSSISGGTGWTSSNNFNMNSGAVITP